MQVSDVETVRGDRAVIRAAEQADRQDANVAVTSIDQGLRGGCDGRIVINAHKREGMFVGGLVANHHREAAVFRGQQIRVVGGHRIHHKTINHALIHQLRGSDLIHTCIRSNGDKRQGIIRPVGRLRHACEKIHGCQILEGIRQVLGQQHPKRSRAAGPQRPGGRVRAGVA